MQHPDRGWPHDGCAGSRRAVSDLQRPIITNRRGVRFRLHHEDLFGACRRSLLRRPQLVTVTVDRKSATEKLYCCGDDSLCADGVPPDKKNLEKCPEGRLSVRLPRCPLIFDALYLERSILGVPDRCPVACRRPHLPTYDAYWLGRAL